MMSPVVVMGLESAATHAVFPDPSVERTCPLVPGPMGKRRVQEADGVAWDMSVVVFAENPLGWRTTEETSAVVR